MFVFVVNGSLSVTDVTLMRELASKRLGCSCSFVSSKTILSFGMDTNTSIAIATLVVGIAGVVVDIITSGKNNNNKEEVKSQLDKQIECYRQHEIDHIEIVFIKQNIENINNESLIVVNAKLTKQKSPLKISVTNEKGIFHLDINR